MKKKIYWFLFAFFAVSVGLYPAAYLLFDMSVGLLSGKSDELLANPLWKLGFYTHIYFGGIALLTGWSQFSKKIRSRWVNVHRALGFSYLIAVLLSGTSALYIAFYATGGLPAGLGFGALAAVWLITTAMSFSYIRNKNIGLHQRWMIRSYALTFSAVTLRIWLPLLPLAFNLDFIEAYRIVAWLCWVPNLFVAEGIIVRVNRRRLTPVNA